jgi:hypothetical protein
MYLRGLTMTDERVFSRPNEFLPERWTTEPELVKDSSAFIPFNSGTTHDLKTPPCRCLPDILSINLKKFMLTVVGDRSVLLRRQAACFNGAQMCDG